MYLVAARKQIRWVQYVSSEKSVAFLGTDSNLIELGFSPGLFETFYF